MFSTAILIWALIALGLSWGGMFYLFIVDLGNEKAFAAMISGMVMAALGLVAVAIYYLGGFAR